VPDTVQNVHTHTLESAYDYRVFIDKNNNIHMRGRRQQFFARVTCALLTDVSETQRYRCSKFLTGLPQQLDGSMFQNH